MGSEAPLILFGLLVVGTLFGGAICGIVSAARYPRIDRELASLTKRLHALEARLAQGGVPIEAAPAAVRAPSPPPPRPMVAPPPVQERPALTVGPSTPPPVPSEPS